MMLYGFRNEPVERLCRSRSRLVSTESPLKSAIHAASKKNFLNEIVFAVYVGKLSLELDTLDLLPLVKARGIFLFAPGASK